MTFADRRAHPAASRRASPARDRLVSGAATAIGSLPHLDPLAAAALAVAVHPTAPAAPQLPGRHPAEAMIAQVAAGVPGLTIGPDGELTVDSIDVGAGDVGAGDVGAGAGDLSGEAWRSLRVFLDLVAGIRPSLVKVQVVGPVTFAVALQRAGVGSERARAVARVVVRSRLRSVVAAARSSVPDAGVIAFLDEPALATDHGLQRNDVIDLLSAAFGAAGIDVAVGVHCCGRTDWPAVIAAAPDILAAPVDSGLADEGSGLRGFLERGGWVAWGVVPTHRPLGDDGEGLTRRLLSTWCDAGRAGCDGFRLWRQALVTPDCGLAGFGPSQAERALRLASRVSERLRDQAVAARLALGA